MNVFGRYAEVYDTLYEDKDYKRESREIHELVRKYSDADEILMLGCGTGRHDRELSRYGYRIHGIDMSSEMIVCAQNNKNELPLSYEVADIREYKSSKKYPIILSLFHVISYQSSNDDLIKTFQNVAKELKQAGGIFIFDAWYGVGVLRDLPAVRVKKAETQKYNVMRIANPEIHLTQNLVDVNYEIVIEDKKTQKTEHFKEKHVMRYLFTPEIQHYLEISGLELIDCLDCKTLKEPTYDTWTAYFVVKCK